MSFENLIVINTQGDTFTVEVNDVSKEGIMSVWLNPVNDDLEPELHTIDIMKENLIYYFKVESFKVIYNGRVK